MKLRIAYFGLPLGAWVLSRAGFDPVTIALGHPDGHGAWRVRRRLGRRSLVLGKPDLADPSTVHILASARPDVVLSWFWPRRIPEGVLALGTRGAFGVHPSLLPVWRGPDPYFWAIYAGDRETGVTLHRLDTQYDTGAIIAQRPVAIAAHDTAWSLARKLDRPSLALLVDCARRLGAGEELEGTPQRDEDAIEAPAPDAETLRIAWERPVAAILRLVRAAAPEPGASADLDGHDIDVLAASPAAASTVDRAKVGEARVWAGTVLVRARDGDVALDLVRTAGGSTLRGPEIARLLA